MSHVVNVTPHTDLCCAPIGCMARCLAVVLLLLPALASLPALPPLPFNPLAVVLLRFLPRLLLLLQLFQRMLNCRKGTLCLQSGRRGLVCFTSYHGKHGTCPMLILDLQLRPYAARAAAYALQVCIEENWTGLDV